MTREWAALLLVVTVLMGPSTDRLAGQGLPNRVAKLEEELRDLRKIVKRFSPTGSVGPRGLPGLKGKKGDPGGLGSNGPREGKGLDLEGVVFGKGIVSFYNPEKQRTAVFAAGDKGGLATFWNKSGKRVASSGTTSSESGVARFWNQSGTQIADIGTGSGGGGSATFSNKSGKRVASIGSTTDGNGIVKVNGKTVHDYAEVFDLATREGVVPGTVMSAVDDGVGIAPSTDAV